MKLDIEAIELDTSIQCRANIDTGLVNEYAEAMAEGEKFPPVLLFGTKDKAWIGDGWHRVFAARQLGDDKIDAKIEPGGRKAALKCALSANAIHGNRRSNADKRRCVEIALREFPNLSSRQIAKMCGVSPGLVDLARPEALPKKGNAPPTRTTSDGRQYPATRSKPKPKEGTRDEETRPARKSGPPSMGMEKAEIAVMHLEEIEPNDTERQQAFDYVKGWIANAEAKT